MQNENDGNVSNESLESPRPAPVSPVWVTTDRNERLEAANEMLKAIASCGRKFFAFEDRVSRFELDDRGRIWFVDKYTQKRIYIAYRGNWKPFSDGGTLRALVERLRDFIQQATPLPPSIFGPWPEWVCGGDLWAYGEDMQQVRTAAIRLGMIQPSSALSGDRARTAEQSGVLTE